ncbi:MAG: pyruvate dehydrogenase complex dihydrolipoamide acetyltransferase [Herbaspirillum sp.]
MAKLIRMPEISANVSSAVIKTWSKKEGDSILVGECLAEIETDKAMIEFDADEAGVLGKILTPAGKDVEVGTPIAVLYAAGEAAADINALLATTNILSSVPLKAPPLNAAINTTTTLHPVTLASVTIGVATVSEERIFASPLARRLARERGLDLSILIGSGPHGRIVKRDVEAAPATIVGTARASDTTPPPNPANVTNYIEIPHSNIRRTIARRLSESKASIPHYYVSVDCRMDKLIALRSEINVSAVRKISINDFIIKAVAVALREIPEMNVSWTDTALRNYAQVDISVAVSTDNGLITPVVRSADNKTLSDINVEIADLAVRARAGCLAPEEYQGGSFTISNLGMYGVRDFAAIINPPQAAILAVGATEQRPVVIDGALAVAAVMTITLSVDHRAIDGALASKWLATLKYHIENPLSILI